MKTKIVRGTEGKYSIREDGSVFVNYKLDAGGNVISNIPEPIKIVNGRFSCSNTEKEKNKTLAIGKVLYEHFGFFYCNKCGKKETEKDILVKSTKCICNECDTSSTTSRYYISKSMGIKEEDLTDETYYLQLKIMELKREIKFLKKDNHG